MIDYCCQHNKKICIKLIDKKFHISCKMRIFIEEGSRFIELHSHPIATTFAFFRISSGKGSSEDFADFLVDPNSM